MQPWDLRSQYVVKLRVDRFFSVVIIPAQHPQCHRIWDTQFESSKECNAGIEFFQIILLGGFFYSQFHLLTDLFHFFSGKSSIQQRLCDRAKCNFFLKDLFELLPDIFADDHLFPSKGIFQLGTH